MSLEKGRINKRQLMLGVSCYIVSAFLYNSILTNVAKQDVWLIILLGFLCFIPFHFIYSAIHKRYPDLTIIQIFEKVYGKVLGKFISFLYFYFFMSLAIINLADINDFVHSTLLDTTPSYMIIISFMFICGWAVKHGCEGFMRLTHFFFALVLFYIFITTPLLFEEIDFSNLLPAFNQPLIKYIQGIHTTLTIPIGEVFVFFMLIPYVTEKEHVTKCILKGAFAGAMILLYVTTRDMLVLGPSSTVVSSTTLEAVRLIDIGNVFTRLELIFTFIFLANSFFKMSILIYACVFTVAQIANTKDYVFIIFPVCVIISVICMYTFESTGDRAIFAITTGPTFSSIYLILFPVLTLIVDTIKIKIIDKRK